MTYYYTDPRHIKEY